MLKWLSVRIHGFGDSGCLFSHPPRCGEMCWFSKTSRNLNSNTETVASQDPCLFSFGDVAGASLGPLLNWIRNSGRGGFPIFAFGEHMYRATFPNWRNSLSDILASLSRSCFKSSGEFAASCDISFGIGVKPGLATLRAAILLVICLLHGQREDDRHQPPAASIRNTYLANPTIGRWNNSADLKRPLVRCSVQHLNIGRIGR